MTSTLPAKLSSSRIPEGASVMPNTSVTLDETGIADAINDGGPPMPGAPRTSSSSSARRSSTLEAAHERSVEHSLKLEDARAIAVYEQNSFVGKDLEIRRELPGRTHVVLIRQ